MLLACTLLSNSEMWPPVIGKATTVLLPAIVAVAGPTGATETPLDFNTPAVAASSVTWVPTPVSLAIVAVG